MENPEKISLQFELLNTYYSKIACKMSHTPKIVLSEILWTFLPFYVNAFNVIH